MKNIFFAIFATLVVVTFNTSFVSAAEKSYDIRVRLWEWDSIPEGLQNKIMQMNKDEGFNDKTAVSRNLGASLVKSWDRGKATTVNQKISFSVMYPGSGGWKSVSAEPGEHKAYPKLVYWEKKILRRVASAPASKFRVLMDTHGQKCSVLYPRENQAGRRLLDTRLNFAGSVSELAKDARRGSEGFNLNIILDCE